MANYEYLRNGFIRETPKWTRRGTELSNWKDNVPSWSFSAFVNKMGPWLRSSACKGSLNWRDLRWRCLGNDKSQFLKHWESGSEELQTIACKEKGMETNEWDLAGYVQPLFTSWRTLPVKLLEMFSTASMLPITPTILLRDSFTTSYKTVG